MSKAKEIVLKTAELIALPSLISRSAWRRSRLGILCYHGVSLRDEHASQPALYVSPQHLRRRLEHLRQGGFNVLTFDDALGRLFSGSLPPRSIALTFDDGMIDFAEVAVPILRDYEMPATVYVTTYYAEKRLPVFDIALRYILWRGRHRQINLADFGLPSRPICLDVEAHRADAWNKIYSFAAAQWFSAYEKHRLLAQVALKLGIDFDEFLASGMFTIMSPEQIRALPRNLIDVQLHTHRHRTPQVQELFHREIDDNRSRLLSMTGGVTAPHFCYPNGDYKMQFLPWLREAGVRSATTCAPGLSTRRSNPLLLPRFVDTSTTSDAVFGAWVSGLAEFLPRRRKYRLEQEPRDDVAGWQRS